jgi:23S rRNA (adenine2503-C2)-methyltransferase
MKVDLKGLNAADTEAWIKELGLERYRAKQIRHWIFIRLISDFKEMTNVSAKVKELLAEKANLNHLKTVKVQESKDTTKKFLFRLHDGQHIETVLIPEKDHFTLCISSQVGCAMGCRFCLTGTQGFTRNLTSAEIIDQIVQVKRSMEAPELLTNIVFMGMGEPLANYLGVTGAIENLIASDGMNYSHRRVTLSTCGIVPMIRRLGTETKVSLAISLNAADDKTRDFLMPVNKTYNLKSLISACRDFPLANRKMITFEYILIKGVNDRPEDAKKITRLLSGLRVKINLIPFNECPGLDLKTPDMESILAFQEVLTNNKFTAIIRKSKGRDISAACGQLRGETTPKINLL